VVTGGYAGAAVILRRMGFEASLRKTLDIVLLLVVTIASAGMVACGFVATYAISGIVPWRFSRRGLSFLIGDATDIIVLAPPLLILNRLTGHPGQPIKSALGFSGRRP
jgi:integral membrane sensor domain MASE1